MLDRLVVQKQIVVMEEDGTTEGPLGSADASDVVDVCVRQQDPTERDVFPLREASSVFTSSPGSMRTPSRVLGHATTNPFLKKGPTASDSTMITR